MNQAWLKVAPAFSISSAYRWVKRWAADIGWIRSLLIYQHPPPENSAHLNAQQTTLLHLQQFARNAHCPVEYFQITLQRGLFS